MSTMIMSQQPPPRKPVPGRPPPGAMSLPQYNLQAPKQQPHSRSRTNSSTALPYLNTSPPRSTVSTAYSMTSSQQPPPPPPQQQAPPPPPQPGQARRTLSNATSSTSNSSNSNIQRVPTNPNYGTANGVRRSTSSRSNGSSISPTSYVALMRKQKGTVWCDRAQHEDPRLLQAQRQAKMRAAAEVAGGHNYATQARTTNSSTGVVGGVRSKIRHHGAPKASAYNAAVVGGAGVPMRLSASEVDDGNESEDEMGAKSHARNGSGRSSIGSGGNRPNTYLGAGLNHSHSNGSTSSNRSPVEGMDHVPEEETPMQRTNSIQGDDYFTPKGDSGGSSGDPEEQFGTVSKLPHARGKLTAEEQAERAKKNAEDLQRRGSVDDRTMTMSAVRLFVANPDADSD